MIFFTLLAPKILHYHPIIDYHPIIESAAESKISYLNYSKIMLKIKINSTLSLK